jgi:hypothetical protein
MNIKNFALFLLSIFSIWSCEKDDTSSSSLIVGRWSLSPTTYELYTNGTSPGKSEEKYASSDYAEFKKDGTLETKANGGPFIFKYRVEADTIIFSDTRKAKIKILTSKTFSYVFTEQVNVNQTNVTTFNLTKP